MPESPPISVLDAFPILWDRISVQPAAPGFSGATVWKIETASNAFFALKAYDPGVGANRLNRIQSFQIRAAEAVAFVPKLRRDRNRETAILNGGRCWELCDWMPGDTGSSRADFEMAFEGLGRIHSVWGDTAKAFPHCPAIERRIDLFREWHSRRPFRFDLVEPRLNSALSKSERHVAENLSSCQMTLERFRNRSTRVQIVVGDPRREHVFFRDGALSGWIDFGAIKSDCIEADFARLAVDWGFEPGTIRNSLDPALLDILIRTGRVGSLANWQLRCSSERFDSATQLRIADRLEWLLHSAR